MKKIQDIFYLNSKHYSDLSNDDKKIIDIAAEALIVWKELILSFDEKTLNIITKDERYSMVIQSEFPDDLTCKIFTAWINAKSM